jgi:carbon monoxide dehydrogenase subunit G
MKKLKSALLGFAIALALLVLAGFLLPSHWQVRRSITVHAPPDAIYPLLIDFRNGWPRWSAFDREDPEIQYRFSGAATGRGAERSWTSPRMGNGSQRILEASPDKGITFELQAGSFGMTGEIALQPMEGGTQVTWTDSGDVGARPFARYFALAMNRMMGPKFEASLAALKQIAEAPPQGLAPVPEPTSP